MTEASSRLSLEQLRQRVGSVLGVSPWYDIDQPLINHFADITRDDYYIHTDPVRAAEGPYGTTIAHGMLMLSLLSDMAARALPVCEGFASAVNYGFDRVRFIAPVPCGSRIRATFTLLSLTERGPSQLLVQYRSAIQIDGQHRPAVTADWLCMVFRASP